MPDESLEQRLTATIERLEKKVDALEERLSPALDSKQVVSRRSFGHIFWGGVLFILGALWLAREENWIDFGFELLPVALIALGLYLILVPRR